MTSQVMAPGGGAASNARHPQPPATHEHQAVPRHHRRAGRGGLIHLLPLAGVLGADKLAALYGIPIAGPDLTILMRHRAVLFGLIGVFCLAAALHEPLRWAALLMALASVLAFLALAWGTGGYNAAIARVVTADVIAAVLLVAGIAAHAWR
jgi:hypothetical protein